MQTFLPYEDFRQSAEALDYQRLGKQRVETFQLLNVIRGVDKFGEPKQHKGWVNHPATVMWRQYPTALAYYGYVMCDEWKRRGYNDSLSEKFVSVLNGEGYDFELPYWLGREELHRSHQSNLLRKKPEFYAELFCGVPDDLPYVWYPETRAEFLKWFPDTLDLDLTKFISVN
jgi:hypothetical protein